MIYAIVEAQKGTRAVNRSKLREVIRAGTMPDPHFPGGEAEFPDAAE